MGKNLIRAPLIGICYGAMLWFITELLPRSESFSNVTASFVMPRMGLLMLLAWTLAASLAYAMVFGGATGGGFGLLLPVLFSACGLQWAVPLLPQLMLGEKTGAMTTLDTLYVLMGGCGITVLALLFCLMVYQTAEPPNKPGAQKTPAIKYRVSVPGLMIRMLVLPILYFALSYLLWYLLFWKVEAARAFYNATEYQTFMKELIILLTERGWEALITLLTGFAYALFSLPVLFRLQGKRGQFIAANVLFYVTGALVYLIPNPVLPDAVRMAHLPEKGLLLLVYAILSGFLLHTAVRREAPVMPAQVPARRAPAQPAQTPQAQPPQAPAHK